VNKIVENKRSTAGDEFHWRRIELVSQKDKNKQMLSVDESNFEKEINHLGHLQQRNQLSL